MAYVPPGLRCCARCNSQEVVCSCRPRQPTPAALAELEESRARYTLHLLEMPRAVALTSVKEFIEELAASTEDADLLRRLNGVFAGVAG